MWVQFRLKYFFFLGFIFLTLLVSGQVNTIKIRKESNPQKVNTCNFQFIADTAMIGKIIKASHYKFYADNTFRTKAVDDVVAKLGLIREKPYLITQENFEKLFKEACHVDHWRLDKLVLESVTGPGMEPHVMFKFYYVKEK